MTSVQATTPEELGFLAGGPGRAAETPLAGLLDTGAVRISREGFVSGVDGARPRSALEATILGGLRAGAQPIGDVVRAAAFSPAADAVKANLAARGLLSQDNKWAKFFGVWKPLTADGRRIVKRTQPQERVQAVALHGLRGSINRRPIAGYFELAENVVWLLPTRKTRKRGRDTDSCGSGCGSSSCGSSCSSGDGGGGGCGGGGGD